MEGKCQEIARTALKFYQLAERMHLPGVMQELRDYDSFNGLLRRQRVRLVWLNDLGVIRAAESTRLFKVIDDLEDGKITEAPESFPDNALDMVIHAIADCECNREIDTLSDADKARIRLDVSTPSRTGAIRG